MLTVEELDPIRKRHKTALVLTAGMYEDGLRDMTRWYADDVGALLAHITEQEAALRQVQAEAAITREALMPFTLSGESLEPWLGDDLDATFTVTIGDIRKARTALSSTPATSAYAARVAKMEEALNKLQHDLEYWQTTPCLSALLGEDPEEQSCGCASCWAKQALPLVRAALEGER